MYYLKIAFVVLFCLLVLYFGITFAARLIDSVIANRKNRNNR